MTWRNLISSTALTMLGVLFMALPAFAGTVDLLQIPVENSEGEAPVGLAATIYTTGGEYLEYSTVNESGYLNYYGSTGSGYEDGTYSLNITPAMSFDCDECGLLSEQTIAITVNSANTSDFFGQSLQTLDTVVMEAASRYVTVTVVDTDGLPAAGVYVNAWNQGNDYAFGTADENGQYQFAVSDDDTSLWTISTYHPDGTYAEGWLSDQTIASTGETEIEVEVLKPDASITATLLLNGSAHTLGDSEFGSVYCYDPETYLNYYYGNIDAGESTATINVVAGTYQCDAWVQGYGASTTGTVTVESEGTAEMDVTLLQYSATANIELQDTNGDTITDIASFSIFASSVEDPSGNEFYGDYVYADGSNGTAELELLDGYTYEVGYWINTSFEGLSEGVRAQAAQGKRVTTGVRSVATGTSYIQDYSMERVTGDEDEDQTVAFTLKEADVTAEVTVLDSDGNPDAYAWVDAMEFTSSSDFDGEYGWGNYVGGMTDENGVATLSLTSTVDEYMITAWPTSAFDGSTLPPGEETLQPVSGQTHELTMQAREADWTINISTEAEDDTTLDYSYCYAYSPSLGIENFAEMSGGKGTVAVMSGSNWYVGCMGYAQDSFYRSDDVSYTSGSTSGGEGDLTVTLSEGGNYYEETSYSIPATTTTTITLPDGQSEMTFPANAIDDSGTLTLTVETATGYSVEDDGFPVDAYNFTILDSSGSVVEEEFESNVTLVLVYDEDRLADYGISEDSLVGGSYDDDQNSWGSPVSQTVDTDENTITIVLNHFSAYGALGNKKLRSSSVEESLNKPRALKAKKIKKKAVRLTWKKPRGADNSDIKRYRVQVRKCTKATKKACSKTKNYVKKKKYRSFKKVKKQNARTVKRKEVKKLKAGTFYQFRVRACGGSSIDSCGDFAKWKRFKTKKAS